MPVRIVSVEVGAVRNEAWPYQHGQSQKSDHYLEYGVQSMRHEVCLFLRRALESLLTLPPSAPSDPRHKIERYFLTVDSQPRNFALPITQKL